MHISSYMTVMTAALYLGLERTLMSIFCFVVSNTQSCSCRKMANSNFCESGKIGPMLACWYNWRIYNVPHP